MSNVIETNALYGQTRRTTVPNYSDLQLAAPGINNRGELLSNFVLPERSELVRMGCSWGAQIPAASAFTLLITIPTTRAELSLQNGEDTATGKSYIIDRFWVKAVTSTASAGVITPLAQIVPRGTTLVADNTAVLRYNLSGRVGAYNGLAQLCIASTATGCLTDKWMHYESALQSMTTNIAACKEVLCYGRYIVPPGANFSLNAQESVSGGTAIMGVEWHEVYLPLA